MWVVNKKENLDFFQRGEVSSGGGCPTRPDDLKGREKTNGVMNFRKVKLEGFQ